MAEPQLWSTAVTRLAHDRETAGEIRPLESHGEEEAQGRDRAVDARRADTGLGLVQLETAHLLGRRCVGRAADEGRERRDKACPVTPTRSADHHRHPPSRHPACNASREAGSFFDREAAIHA